MLKKKKVILASLALMMSCSFINGFSIAFADETEDVNLIAEEVQGYNSTNNEVIWGEDNNYIWSTNNTCTINGITFDINSNDNTVGITKVDTTIAGTLIVPSKIKVNNNYYNVTVIESRSFLNCNNLTEVIISENIKTLKAESFCWCENLGRIYIPSTVNDLGIMYSMWVAYDTIIGSGHNNEYFISNCANIKSIDVNANNSYYSSKDGVLYNKGKTELMLYPQGKEDTYFEIDRGVTSIKEQAFRNCKNLSSIKLPDSITSLQYKTFDSCEDLTNVFIGKNINSIDLEAFSNCNNLKNINVDSDNQNFSDIDGVLFNKDKTKLITYPSNKADTSYSIPKSVSGTEMYAFLNCRNLKSISLPDTVSDQDLFYLYNSYTLKSIWTVPSQNIAYQPSMMIYKHPPIIESNLYNRENYINDVIKIKADSVQCIEKLSNGQERFRKVSLSDDGYFIHDPSRESVGTRYYYYRAVVDGTEYTSPVISVTVNPENVQVPEETVLSWDNENKCLVDNIEYTKNIDGSVRVSGNEGVSGEVIIPESITVDNIEYTVTDIEKEVFANNSAITKVIIADSVESIGNCTFANCSNLKEVVLSNNLKSIGWFAFSNCISLQSITIPSSVKTIGNGAFWYNIGLENGEFKGEDTAIGSGAFYQCVNCQFKVHNDEMKDKLVNLGVNESQITVE